MAAAPSKRHRRLDPHRGRVGKRQHRAARRKGLTIRKPNDCLIAALALEHAALLVHNDRDFLALAQVEPSLLIYPGRAH